MEREYSSMLTKNVLAYNLAYHLKDVENKSDIYRVVIKLLDEFEYKTKSEKETLWKIL